MTKYEISNGFGSYQIKLDNNRVFFDVPKEIVEIIMELEGENKKLNGAIETYDILLKSNVEENKNLKEKVKLLNKMNEENYEKYCNELKKNRKAIENLKEPYLIECEQQCKDVIEILGGDKLWLKNY